MTNQIVCPHCKKVQSDCTNGGDARLWWQSDYIPEGECEVYCEHCNKLFTVICRWEPHFTVADLEEMDE